MPKARANDLIDIFLQPGEHFVGDANFRVRTLLGSCVSIVLWHASYRVGAMCHFLLPSRNASCDGALDGRYGEESMLIMSQELKAIQVNPTQCVAKIFGGGNMFPGQTRADARNVGLQNGEAARELLLAHRIPVVSESLFGIGHRQIIFDISNGDVWARQIRPSDPLVKQMEQMQ
ncbi:MAG: chemotaxis protein CheD [Rhodoferax sp.]